jgi:hypothetical protein
VVEDTFWQVWRQAPRFDVGRGKAITWLLAMARSRAIDALRRDKRFAHDEMPDDDAVEDADDALPADLVDAARRGQAVHLALAQAGELDWQTEGTARVLFWIADAPPHAEYYQDALTAPDVRGPVHGHVRSEIVHHRAHGFGRIHTGGDGHPLAGGQADVLRIAAAGSKTEGRAGDHLPRLERPHLLAQGKIAPLGPTVR